MGKVYALHKFLSMWKNDHKHECGCVLILCWFLFTSIEVRIYMNWLKFGKWGKLGKASLRCEPCGSGVASLIGFLWYVFCFHMQ